MMCFEIISNISKAPIKARRAPLFSASDLIASPLSVTAAFGVSISEAFANTETVGRELSTIPMAS